MRTRLIALSAVVTLGVLGLGGPSLAQSEDGSGLPDLPGMRVADRATRGEVADFRPKASDTTSGTASTSSSSTGTRTTSPVKASNGVDASPILELPGTGGLPLISEVKAGLVSVRRGLDSVPWGLQALAALGTIVSLGLFLAFRNRLAAD